MDSYYTLNNSDGTSKVVRAGETIEEVAEFNSEDKANEVAESLNNAVEVKQDTEWLDKTRSEM